MGIMHWLTGRCPGLQTTDLSCPEIDFEDVSVLLDSCLRENGALKQNLRDAEAKLVNQERSRNDLVDAQTKHKAEVS